VIDVDASEEEEPEEESAEDELSELVRISNEIFDDMIHQLQSVYRRFGLHLSMRFLSRIQLLSMLMATEFMYFNAMPSFARAEASMAARSDVTWGRKMQALQVT
jgi:hypothetical protein